MLTKDNIREIVSERRKHNDREDLAECSRAVQDAATRLAAFDGARWVACYLAQSKEVATARLIDESLSRGKRVCVPAWRADARCYGLAVLDRDTPLQAGPLRIPQPADPQWIEPATVDFVAVPGLAFDAGGGRVGHGGGHYDRLLAGSADTPYKVGLAFDFQIFDEVPTGPRDVLMDAVVTETRSMVVEDRQHARA